jgi:hypothetical protein
LIIGSVLLLFMSEYCCSDSQKKGTTKLHNCSGHRMIFHCQAEPIRG